MNKIKFTVASGNILLEASRHFNQSDTNSPGLVEGLEMIRSGLAIISNRAIELKDEKLLGILQNLGCIHVKEKRK